MLIFLDLDPVTTALPSGALQIGASVSTTTDAGGASAHSVEPAALRAAAAVFLKDGADLGVMFAPGAVGVVTDIAVSPKGAVSVTATVSDPVAVRKVQAGVLRCLGLAIKVLKRSPADPAVITAAEIIGAALVDRPDEAFSRLAKGASTASDAAAATMIAAIDMRFLETAADLLDLSRRLTRYERPSAY